MPRLSAFDREFRNLHGATPLDLDGIVTVQPPRRRRGVDHLGLRLTVGFLGLFWGGVFGVALLAFVFVAGVFTWAFFTT